MNLHKLKPKVQVPFLEPISDPQHIPDEGEPERAAYVTTPGMRFDYRGLRCAIDTRTLTMPVGGSEVQYYDCTIFREGDTADGSISESFRGTLAMDPETAEQDCRDMVDAYYLRIERRNFFAVQMGGGKAA